MAQQTWALEGPEGKACVLRALKHARHAMLRCTHSNQHKSRAAVAVHAHHQQLHCLQALPAAQAHTGRIHCLRAAVPTQQKLLQLVCGWMSWCPCHLRMRQSGKTMLCLGCQPRRSTRMGSCHPPAVVAAAAAKRACLSCCCCRCWPSRSPAAPPAQRATEHDDVSAMCLWQLSMQCLHRWCRSVA
jgi:hypothetical protein